jgi:hypothetical protein
VTPRLALALATLSIFGLLRQAQAQDCPADAAPLTFSPEQLSRYQASLRQPDVRFLRQVLNAHASGKAQAGSSGTTGPNGTVGTVGTVGAVGTVGTVGTVGAVGATGKSSAAGMTGMTSSTRALGDLASATAASRFAVLRVQAGMLGTRHIALVFQQEPGRIYHATTLHGHTLVEFRQAPLNACQTRQLSAQLGPLLADPQLAI